MEAATETGRMTRASRQRAETTSMPSSAHGGGHLRQLPPSRSRQAGDAAALALPSSQISSKLPWTCMAALPRPSSASLAMVRSTVTWATRSPSALAEVLAGPWRCGRRPDRAERLVLPADAPAIRRQRARRAGAPPLRPHHEGLIPATGRRLPFGFPASVLRVHGVHRGSFVPGNDPPWVVRLVRRKTIIRKASRGRRRWFGGVAARGRVGRYGGDTASLNAVTR